jgi:hypothetical protein
MSPYYRISAPDRGFACPPKSPQKTQKQIYEEESKKQIISPEAISGF